ncbi:MAG: DUF6597 domain-containing transcriptional factor [Blastocatellia bacterium]
MHYREIQPGPALAAYVECFWLLTGDGAHPSGAPERLLPDGCVELILNCGAPFREYDAAGNSELQPMRFAVGQMTRPVLVTPTGEVRLLGIRFATGGTLPFLSVAPAEITDRVTPLGDLASRLERDLSEAVEGAEHWRDRIARIEAALLRHLRAGGAEGGVSLRPVLAHILGRGGRVGMDDLAAGMGIGARQLERRFLREVGLGPKLLCRILRFQQVFRAVERADASWVGVADECGYYDQAHLIRDFRQFAWQTPAVLFEDISHFTEMFTRKRRVSHFSNTPD